MRKGPQGWLIFNTCSSLMKIPTSSTLSQMLSTPTLAWNSFLDATLYQEITTQSNLHCPSFAKRQFLCCGLALLLKAWLPLEVIAWSNLEVSGTPGTGIGTSLMESTCMLLQVRKHRKCFENSQKCCNTGYRLAKWQGYQVQKKY